MRNYNAKFEEGKFYHIYNRGNNRENLFYCNENYEYFLRKFDEYISDYLDVYAFSLLPNHFHFLVQVKEKSDAIALSDSIVKKAPIVLKSDAIPQRDSIAVNTIITNQFRKFFITYAQAINVQRGRVGSLFQKRFKRLEVNNPKYFAYLVYYLHTNPQLHKIIENFKLYPWSSYNRIMLGKPTKLKKESVIEWFNNKDNYMSFHSKNIDLNVIKELMIE